MCSMVESTTTCTCSSDGGSCVLENVCALQRPLWITCMQVATRNTLVHVVVAVERSMEVFRGHSWNRLGTCTLRALMQIQVRKNHRTTWETSVCTQPWQQSSSACHARDLSTPCWCWLFSFRTRTFEINLVSGHLLFV